MTIYGYARVSTNGQDLAAQEAELMAAGCAKVFKEKVSGAKTDRAELAKVIRRLEPGDVLVATRLDRLARSTRDLLNVLATIGEREAGFRSLKDTWANTTTPHGRLMLTVLGGLAEFERELIRARTGDGRARAKARGVKFGRPTALTPHQRQEVMQRLAQGEAQADLARSYGVSHDLETGRRLITGRTGGKARSSAAAANRAPCRREAEGQSAVIRKARHGEALGKLLFGAQTLRPLGYCLELRDHRCLRFQRQRNVVGRRRSISDTLEQSNSYVIQ
jgi:DNA invertase Pin-like site-specific DNA recombinase